MTSADDTFPHNYLSTSPAHGVPGQSFLYAGSLRSPSPILLELPIPSPKSRGRYASYVWNAGVVLADKMAECEIDVRGKRVLELGCGLGLPTAGGPDGSRIGTLSVAAQQNASVDAMLMTSMTLTRSC